MRGQEVEIALLKQTANQHKSNWGKVVNTILGILNMILLGLLAKLGFGN